MESKIGTIIHLDDATSWRGGQQQVLYLHQGLLALGHDSRVICKTGSALQQRLHGEKLPHYAIRIMGAHDLIAARRIGALAQTERAILHTHTSHAHDLGLWAHRMSATLRHQPAPSVPLVVSRRVDFPVGRSWLSARKYRSARVRRYLAISSAVESELTQGGVDASLIRRVPSGIDLSRFEDLVPDQDWRARLGLRHGELLFGSVAALAPHKDQATLLGAFARFRERGGQGHLLILGEGELRGALEDQRAKLGLQDHVSLPGFTDDVLPKLAAMDIFVLSSKTEGLGTSILDAMATQRPTIVTRAGGIVDVVENGVSGRLVDVGDIDALAATMLELQSSSALRQKLAEGARLRVEEFDVRRTVERTIDAYVEIRLEDEAS